MSRQTWVTRDAQGNVTGTTEVRSSSGCGGCFWLLLGIFVIVGPGRQNHIPTGPNPGGRSHLIEAPGHFDRQPYMGVLFWLTAAGSWIAAAGIVAGVRGSWVLGAFVSAATFFGLILAVTVGLPNVSENLGENLAVPSLGVEAGFLVLYIAAATGRRTPFGM
jgi:hypothetical protein